VKQQTQEQNNIIQVAAKH